MSFLDEEPQGDETTVWFGGVFVPLPFLVYGLLCIINQAGAFPGKRGSIPFTGIDAIILGLACLFSAGILHFHYFWGLNENEKLKDNYEYGKLACIVALIPTFGWVTWYMLRGFMEIR